MKLRTWSSIANLVAHGLPLRSGATSSLFSSRYLPHRYCYLAQSGLVWTNAIADGSIATACTMILTCLFLVGFRIRSMPGLRGYSWLPFSFGLFIVTCGVTHAMDVVTVWLPFYPLSATVKVLCAIVSIPTTIYLARTTPMLVAKLQRLPAQRTSAIKPKLKLRPANRVAIAQISVMVLVSLLLYGEAHSLIAAEQHLASAQLARLSELVTNWSSADLPRQHRCLDMPEKPASASVDVQAEIYRRRAGH